MTTAPLEAELARHGWQAFLTALFQMAFGLLLIFPLLRFKVLTPVRSLVGQSQALAAGQLDAPFVWRRRDELGALGRSFENTRRSLQRPVRLARAAQRRAPAAEPTSPADPVLRATLDNMTDGISLIDREARLVAWNDRFVEIFDLPPDAVHVGQPIVRAHMLWVERSGLSEAEAASLTGRMRESFSPGTPFTLQIETPAARSSCCAAGRCPMAASSRPTPTSPSRCKRGARRTRRCILLDTVMDAVPAILHVKDRDLRYRFVNRYFLDLFGLRARAGARPDARRDFATG